MSKADSDEFANVAREFVYFSEEHTPSIKVGGDGLAHLLAKLYSAAMLLVADSELEVSLPKDSIEFTKQRVKRRLQNLSFRYYSRVFDPHTELAEEVVNTDIVLDLLNVYSELRAGLDVWEQGNHPLAICQWKESFELSWGQQVLGALVALHSYSVDSEEDVIA